MSRVLRFTPSERALHWAFAAGYLLLVLTGLPLTFPGLRGLIRGYTPVVGERLHLVCAAFWVLATLAVVLLGDRPRLRASLRELGRLARADWAWLAGFPRWLVARAARRRQLDGAVGRFNGGQKLNALFTLVTATLLALTGLALWPLGAEGLWRDLHRWLTLVVLVPVAGHIYLAALHPGTRGSLSGMLDGRVEREWAARHHPRWEPE